MPLIKTCPCGEKGSDQTLNHTTYTDNTVWNTGSQVFRICDNHTNNYELVKDQKWLVKYNSDVNDIPHKFCTCKKTGKDGSKYHGSGSGIRFISDEGVEVEACTNHLRVYSVELDNYRPVSGVSKEELLLLRAKRIQIVKEEIDVKIQEEQAQIKIFEEITAQGFDFFKNDVSRKIETKKKKKKKMVEEPKLEYEKPVKRSIRVRD